MSNIIDTLVYDRTDGDLSALKSLAEAVSNETATEEEESRYLTPQRGGYTYADWNRVGEACAWLYAELTRYGLMVSGYSPLRTDWTKDDIPPASAMATYLSTVEAIKSVWDSGPDIPASMSGLTIEGANNIERVIYDTYKTMTKLVYSWHRSAEFSAYSGEQFVPTANMDIGRTWEELDAMERTWANWQAATWYLLLYGNLEAEEDVT